MRRAAAFGAAALLGIVSGAAWTATKAWNTRADFEDNPSSYAMVIDTRPAGTAFLTLDFRYDYAQDPGEAFVAPTSNSYWTKKRCAVTYLPTIIFSVNPVSVFNRIYLVGGEEKNGAQYGFSAKVRYIDIGATGFMQSWKDASYQYQTVTAGTKGVGVYKGRIIAVGDRIYVVGGSLNIPVNGGASYISQTSTTDVYSTKVNKATGDIGPWTKEPSLIKMASQEGLVYAAGALFSIGGVEEKISGAVAEPLPHPWVQKAEIKPDGHLATWVAVTQVPGGYPPPPTGSDPPCACRCVSNPPCDPYDEECCRQQARCIGWSRVSSFGIARTIGFLGASFHALPQSGDACRNCNGAYYTYLNECNEVVGWVGQFDSTKRGRANAWPQVFCGSVINTGGDYSGAVPDVVHNSSGGQQGITRDSSFGFDSTELRLNYEYLDVDSSTDFKFPLAVAPAPACMVGPWIYVMGFVDASMGVYDQVYRTQMAPTAQRVDAGYYISNPFDMGQRVRLTNVSWTFSKYGTGVSAAAPDDWAMVRYRLADEDGKWSCWSPRSPEAGNMPLSPGTHVYCVKDEAGNATPRASRYWVPLNDTPSRFIQFEVSLYKGQGTPNVPEFGEFRVEYEPAPADPKPENKLEVWPIPATDEVSLRFEVAAEGAEVTIRAYNAGLDLVSDTYRVYASGGKKTEKISTRGFANGPYIILLDARGLKGNPGLAYEGEVYRKAKGKFVVRRKK